MTAGSVTTPLILPITVLRSWTPSRAAAGTRARRCSSRISAAWLWFSAVYTSSGAGPGAAPDAAPAFAMPRRSGRARRPAASRSATLDSPPAA